MSIRDYGLAVPHGPNPGGEHVATANLADMSSNESGVFQSLLKPDDSYDENGVYWADMSLAQRARFTGAVDRAEAKKELSATWALFKRDPLAPVGYYARNMVIPGAGLLLEGYVECLTTIDRPMLTKSPVTSSSPLVMSSLCFKPLSLPVGKRMILATQPGSTPSTILRLSESLLVRSSSVSLAIGSDAAGALFKMPLSCLSVCSCSLLHGVLLRTAGSFATSGLSSSMVSVLVVNTP